MIYEIFFFLILLKVLVDMTKGKCLSRNGMTGKTVLLTGANSGIGIETARELAKRGARIIMASRNTNASEKIKADIIKETNNTDIVVKHLDVSLRQSIRDFVDDLKLTETKIDVLIHNAGIGPTEDMTSEKQNATLATNLFGPFLLTSLLIDLLKKAPSARVIFVSSVLAVAGKINFSEMTDCGEIANTSKSLYCISKYGEILLAHEMTDRLVNTKIMVNSLHPGVIITRIFESNKVSKFLVNMFWFLCKTTEEGAQTTLHVAIDDVGGAVSGRLFIDCRQLSVYTRESDRENGRILWDKCIRIMKMEDYYFSV